MLSQIRFAKISTAAIALCLAGATAAWAQTAPDADMIAKGKAIFDAGTGGIPCAACHGDDPTSIIGPTVMGDDAGMVHEALANVVAMQSLTLTDDDIAAVSAYLTSSGGKTVTIPSVAGAVPVTSAQHSLNLAVAGKEIFESGPNGVGCKECHGHDATVLVAPDLGGKSAMEVHAAIIGIDGMQGLVLSADDLKAVAAYLTQQAGK